MNILLVEDNMLKRKMIEVSLIDIKPDARIRCFRDLRTAEQFIDRNAEYIDLLVLDWCFFETSYDTSVLSGTGELLLDYIKDKKHFIKTVICSGNKIDGEELKSKYDFLLGTVIFSNSNPGKEIYNHYLDYWTKLSLRSNGDILDNEKTIIKKLVNDNVK